MLIDRLICLVSLIIAIVYFVATAQIPSLEIGDPLGPKAFPVLLGVLLLVSVVMLFFETLKPGAKDGPRVHVSAEDRHHLLMIGFVTLWTALYFWLFERAGFLLGTTLYLIVMMAIFHRGKWAINITTAVLFSLACWGLFVKVLGVVLPAGLLSL